jgi:putative oxidoreductase
MSDFVSLISRILMSAVFIVYGADKLMDVNAIVNHAGVKRFLDLVAGGAAAPTWFGYLIVAIELLGGLAILFGIKTRWVAWGLFVYLIFTAVFGHPFWLLEGAARGANQAHFFKNLAIMGGFLLLAIHGAGRYSVDGRTSTPAELTRATPA